MSWSLVILTAGCFGFGFGLSWIRARRRVHARVKQALEQEITQRLRAEIIKRVERGDGLDMSGTAPYREPASEFPGKDTDVRS